MRLRLPSALLQAAALAAAAAACVPAAGLAQSNCSFAEGSRSFQSVTIPGRGQIFYLGTPNFSCADGVRIRADSAVAYQAENMVFFMGNVRFRDPQRLLQSDQARYFTRIGRLQAEGHLLMRDTIRGSVIEHGEMVYLRQTQQRSEEQITVQTGMDRVRPVATLYMRPAQDTAAADSTPVADTAGVDTPSTADSLVADSLAAGDTTAADSLMADSLVVDSLVAGDTVAADSLVADSLAAARLAVGDSAGADSTVAADTAAVLPESGVEPLPEDTAAAPRSDPAPPSRAQRERRREPSPPDTTRVPFQVEADALFLQGDSYFLATGGVLIARESLYARGDSAEYDEKGGRMLLKGSAQVEDPSFNLKGWNIDIGMVGGDMRTVHALRRAELVGKDLTLVAPVIRIALEDGTMQQLVAVPVRPSLDSLEEPDSLDLVRPVAAAQRFVLTADSVEVLAPEEILERIFASGDARGESSARDSLNVEALPDVARTDWLEGDTVIAYFVLVPPEEGVIRPDTAKEEYELDRLEAIGAARSLYRLMPADSTARPGVDAPALHYVTGASITITMVGGEVDRMEVGGATRGWHLEPESRVARRDTLSPDTATVPDTVVVPPDTSVVVPGRSDGRREGTPGGSGGGEGEVGALPSRPPRGSGRERRSGR